MFENIYKLLNNARSLSSQEAFEKSVDQEIKNSIVHLNTVKQLGENGIDSDSDSLGNYAPFTINERSSLGLQVGHVDFKVTGEYWKSWSVEVVGSDIEISVDNDRYNELVGDLRFSDTHVGLTDDNLSILSKEMLFKYQDYARNKIFKS